ncbi:MAG: hypothetical protein ACON4T_05625 [Synechococcus sp.]
MALVASCPSSVSEDKLIDVLRGCEHEQQFLQLRDQLSRDPSNPPLFDWVCSLLVARHLSRGLAARVLRVLHQDCLAKG